MIAIVIIEMLLNFDDIIGDHSGFKGAANYLILRLPAYYFRDLIPVSSFAAALFSVGLAARKHEVLAAKSGGISPQRMVVPILAAAMVLAAGALIVNETIVLSATRAWNHRKNPDDAITFRRGSFWYHRGDTIYNVAEADPETRILHGVRVFDTGPRGRLRQSIEANVAEVGDDHRWTLRHATIRSFDPATPALPPHIEMRAEKILEVASEHDLALLDASAKTLSLMELREYIQVRVNEGQDPERYRGIVNGRIADALTVAVFALIAVALGLAIERTRSLAAAAVTGIVILALFYTARTAASMLTAGGFGSPVIAPWLVLGAFAGFGMAQLARVSR
jgi:lipopolysaccharide export system permease protein